MEHHYWMIALPTLITVYCGTCCSDRPIYSDIADVGAGACRSMPRIDRWLRRAV